MGVQGKPSPKRRKTSKAAAVIAAAVLFAQVSPAFSMSCPTTAEQHALNVRVLQTQLMVAALSCNAKAQYNVFVRRFQGELIPHGKTLRRYFHRTFGEQARLRLNRFVTRLANEQSALRISAGEQYCPDARDLFARVLNAPNGSVAALANTLPLAGTHGIPSCLADQKDFRAARRSQ